MVVSVYWTLSVLCVCVCDIRSEYQHFSQINKTTKRAVGVEVGDHKEEEESGQNLKKGG